MAGDLMCILMFEQTCFIGDSGFFALLLDRSGLELLSDAENQQKLELKPVLVASPTA